VREPAAWAARIAELTDAIGGRLDVLVNNAGILRAGSSVGSQ